MTKEQGSDSAQNLDSGLDLDLDNLMVEQDDQTQNKDSGEDVKEESPESGVQSEEQESEAKADESDVQESKEDTQDTEQSKSEDESSEEGEEKKAAEEYGTDDTLRLYADLLKEKGRLPSSFDLDSIEGDSAEEKIENQVNAMLESLDKDVDSYKQNLDQLSREVNDLVEQGVNYEEAKQRVTDRARIERITEDQLEDNDKLQEYVLKTLYEKKNYSDKDIDKFIKRSRDAESLLEDSKEAREELPGIYKQEDKSLADQHKSQQEQREKQRQETLKKIDKTLDDYKGKELFPGLELKEGDVKKVKEYMTQPVDWEQREDGTQIPVSKEVQIRRKDPVGFSTKLNYLIHMGFFDENVDLNKIGKKQESNVYKKLAKKLNESQKKDRKDQGYSKAKGTEKTEGEEWTKDKMPPGFNIL